MIPALRRWAPRSLLALLFVTWCATIGWQTAKPLPDGLRVNGAYHDVPTESLRFLSDVTSADAFGQRLMTQGIFDATLALIHEAQGFLLVDYFLFNDDGGPELDAGAPSQRPLSSELRQALLARRAADPSLPMLVLVDPINVHYLNDLSPELLELQNAGIDVVVTELDRLRDSNAMYSAAWRMGFKWWLKSEAGTLLPNPLDTRGERVSLGAWMRLLNFKANHRKVALTRDARGQLRGIVASANPHDASSAHSNVAIEVRGPALESLLASELAVARWSGWQGALPPPLAAMPVEVPENQRSRVAVLTEGAILDALLERIGAAGAGTSIDVAMFYLTQRDVIEALTDAARRGASVRVLLDPNKDAFGYEKSGLPNRPMVSELLTASDGAVRVRWYRTHGEQFHAKLVVVRDDRRTWMTLGSANLTRRNLADYNLEANIAVDTPTGGELAATVLTWFDALWSNRAVAGVEYSADAEMYADPSQGRYWLYRLMEGSGLSTF
ncbi:MAG: phospholipase D-like domain-containing protein [Steroidobacteraceae bacterium]